MPGTQRDIPYLEDKFQTGDIPTQQDFYDLFASFLHYLQVKQVTGASTSDVMSQKAISDLFTALKDGVPSAGDTLNKLYNLITAMGRPRGGFDASSGAVPTPTVDNEAGDFWRITVAGTIGTMVLKPGDVLFASIDDAAVAGDFYAVQSNVDQATDSLLGLVKLYADLFAKNTDGAPSQAAVVAALQNGNLVYGVATGTNIYAATFTPTITALVPGQTFRIKFTNGNTGPVTINPDGLGAIALKKNSTTDLGSGDIQPGQIIDVAYDGVNFQILAFYGLNITAAEIAAIPNGETNLFTVTKSIDGSMVSYGAGVSQIDKFGPQGLDALLADSAAWGNLSGKNSDWIRLTGDNRNGDLGQSGQEHVIASNFYLCISHVTGVTAVDGQADWVRNKSIDVETSSSVITDITNETGWANNRKTSVVKTKIGAWYTSLSAGYTYFCYGDNGVNPTAWYWARVGEPQAIDGRISDATLIAEIEAHNFATTPILTPVASVKGEDMQEHFWENPSGTPHVTKCYNISGTIKWVKLL